MLNISWWDYSCPWSIRCKGGAGWSWAIRNTPNISGVEKKTKKEKKVEKEDF
jgi:hypothetical protein